MQNNTVDLLVKILLDKSVDVAERDDAAMDLGAFDDNKSLESLIQVGADETEHDIILWSCGASIADIWLKRGTFSRAALESLTSRARQELYIDPATLVEKP